ncbi:BTAD domain-containing putative transcriptional regulator [Streptomyces sp. NPDC046909]|uniref:AfsR/SARP family transcriptional regulator n=1 Tax=Streptomyces sp. NPDC046909 TaxID=3155617 RepID=UPI0033E6DDA9
MTSMPLRFAVLGEIRVWRDGTEVDPGPPLRRTLLALLLARAGSPVALPDIVDALWADRPPAHAVNMVHRHVGELRRLLEPGLPQRAEGGLLLRGGGGYRLLAPPDSVDLLLFRRLVARAREHGEVGQVVGAYAEALALRRGRAAGCPARAPAHPVFTELDREYDAVVREAAEVALRGGLADHVLPALAESAARHPLDEGLQALLVRALTATGRRAEALDVFRATAGRLADELGVDPGPELSAARAQARADADPGPEGSSWGGAPAGPEPPAAHADTGDRPSAHPDTADHSSVRPDAPDRPSVRPDTSDHASGHLDDAPAHPAVTPAQLPPSLPVFVGRAPELNRLRALLDDAATEGGGAASTVVISTIIGPAGIGKTALAVRLAHEAADRFPDGQLYVDLRGFDPGALPTRPEDAVRGFLAALGVPAARVPEGLDAQAALFRSLAAGRRLLVLLDNARDAAQVRPLLPGTPGCLVLVTSRSRLGGLVSADGAHPVTLGTLAPDEAREALALRIGAARVAAEPRATEEIVRLCARLPLALAVVAARAADRPTFPLETLAEQLRAAQGGLEAFRGDDPAIDVRAVFSWSYDALGPSAARMFRLLALHPGPELTVHAGAALAGEPVPRARALLRELADAHLVAERTPGRYACHDLLRTYAGELVRATESEDARRASLRRLLDHFLHTAHAAALLFDPPILVIDPVAPAEPPPRPQPLADEKAALAWFSTERAVLRGALGQAADLRLDAHVWQLAWCLERFHERYGHWPEYLALQRTALAAARRLADPGALAEAHRGLGRACMLLRRHAEAEEHFRAAGELFGDDSPGQALILLCRWELMTRQERHREALPLLGPALPLYRLAGNRRGEAHVLVATAWGQACLGEARAALAHAHRALALFQELGIPLAEGYTWDALGHIHRQLGRPERSVNCCRRALALFREAGDLFNEACVLDRLGDALHSAGDSDEALHAWRSARDALHDFDPVWAAEAQRKIDRHGARPPVTSQAHFVHCPAPTLPAPPTPFHGERVK